MSSERSAVVCAIVKKAADQWAKPLRLREPSGLWVSAREARSILLSETNMIAATRQAELALARRSGVIPTKVASWSYSWEPADGLDRISLLTEEPDHSDWSSEPSRGAYLRRLSVLDRIGDYVSTDPSEPGLVAACWEAGDFTVILEGDFKLERVGLVGLSFDEMALRDSFGLSLGEPPQDEEACSRVDLNGKARDKNQGGRPASKHGDVIASVVLKLVEMPVAELNRYTVEALSAELEELYRTLGERPPNERSRETYAGGILRVLRGYKT